MPKQREPVDMIKAKGRKHFTKKDIEARKERELDVPFKNILAPNCLDKAQKKEFYDIAYKLLEIGVMTELDEDALARYLIAKEHYLQYSLLLSASLATYDIGKTSKLVTAQDKLFKQVRAAAADLGLTITSRCKINLPDPRKNGYVDL